jgi:hypothetical protein
MHTPSFIIRGASSGFNPPHALTLALRATRFARLEPVCPYRRDRPFGRCLRFYAAAFSQQARIILPSGAVASRPGAIFAI